MARLHEVKTLCIAGKMSLWKRIKCFLKKMRESIYDLSILFLNKIPIITEAGIQTSTFAFLFAAALFTKGKIWKHPQVAVEETNVVCNLVDRKTDC